MNPLLDDIYDFLIAQSAVPSGWVIYKGYIPDDGDQVIALFEIPGLPSQELNRDNERVAFQTRIRAGRLDYAVCRAAWLKVYKTLQDSIPATGYSLVQSTHASPMMFNDDKGRTNMTTNWRVIRITS